MEAMMKNNNVGPGKLDWSKLLGFEQVVELRDAAQTGRLGKIGDKFGKVGRKSIGSILA